MQFLTDTMVTPDIEKIYDEKTRNRALLLLYVATYIFRIAFGATILLIDTYLIYLYNLIYYKQHGTLAPPTDMTLIWILIIVALTYYISESIFAGVIGYFNDHKDVRLIIIYSAYIGAIAMLSYVLGILTDLWHDIIVFAVAHAIHGVAAAMKVTSTVTIITRLSTYEDRGRHMGLYDFTLFLGRVSGIALGGLLWGIFATSEDIEALFHDVDDIGLVQSIIKSGLFSFGVLAVFLIIAGLMLTRLPSLPPERKVDGISVKDAALAPIREFMVMFRERRDLAIPWFFMASLFGLILLWGPRLLLIELGQGGEMSGFIGGYIGLLLGLPAPLWGLIADKIGRKKTVAIGISGFALLVVSIASAVLLFNVHYQDPMLFIIASPSIIFLAALGPSFLARLGDTSERGKHGEVMAGYQFTLALGEINGILSGALSIFIATLIFKGTEWEHLAGLFGIIVLAIAYFLILVIGSFMIKPDEEVLKKYMDERKGES